MPRAHATPNLFITIPPNPIISTHQKPIEPTTTISSPKTPYLSHCCRPTTKTLLRIFPWVVGCTLVLWIFVLRADTPPLRAYSPQQHPPVEGHKPRPLHPPHRHSKSYASSSKLTVWEERAVNVRNSFIHAYNGYRQYAALYDVLLPVRVEGANNLNGWGLTLYDSLDTMWIMGLHGMFRESLGTIARASFSPQIREHEHLYNTVLHHLGGLLSTYALSKESLLLTRADDLGKILLPAALNLSSAIPANLTSEESSMEQNMTSVSWATILSYQLEFKYLAHLTGRIEYYNLTQNFMKIYDAGTTSGSIPNRWDPMTSTSINSGHYDSAQEYLLKQWLLTAKSDSRSLALYLDSIDSIIKNQLYISPNRNLLYLTNLSPSDTSYVPTHRFHHHSCSFPALLALGVHNLGISLPLRDRELHLWAAQGLAYTCWVMYADQGSGLGGEEVKMRFGDGGGMESSTGGEGKAGRWMELVDEWEKKGKKGNGPPGTRENEIYVDSSTAGDRDYVLLRTGYSLNPDLIESFYFMWKITKSDRWRHRGWAIFEAIEKHTRTKHGYASLVDVEEVPSLMKDEMPSYFLGETLKYLYLLFCDDEPLTLNSWVFNSRGHPLPVFDWSTWEKERFNITLG